MPQKPIPDIVVGRLPVYLRALFMVACDHADTTGVGEVVCSV